MEAGETERFQERIQLATSIKTIMDSNNIPYSVLFDEKAPYYRHGRFISKENPDSWIEIEEGLRMEARDEGGLWQLPDEIQLPVFGVTFSGMYEGSSVTSPYGNLDSGIVQNSDGYFFEVQNTLIVNTKGQGIKYECILENSQNVKDLQEEKEMYAKNGIPITRTDKSPTYDDSRHVPLTVGDHVKLGYMIKQIQDGKYFYNDADE